jgi:putative CocE/NonD family hydrolase
VKSLLRCAVLAVFASVLTSAVAANVQAATSDAGFIEQHDVLLPTPDGANVCVLVVRPRTAARVPAVLEFTIYNDNSTLGRTRRSAEHGYAGVTALTRGKGCSPDLRVVPYEHDGADADMVIKWIAAQPWSNGSVGMIGGSYSGFTAWAATKHLPKALKTIVVGAPEGPAIDTPSENGVVWNFIYPWPFYTTDNKTLDEATYSDRLRWARLNREWYVQGAAYRDLDNLDGTTNPWWDVWLTHPTYDAYWQAMIPYANDFAHVTIPVLQTAGYYYGGPAAATYYFLQHHAHDPKAEDYLVVGPWDHIMAQRGADAHANAVAGYTIDPAATIDLVALDYAWFDHVLKGGPKPALLRDHVNFEVTGANVWRHARSIAAMANGSMRLYLNGTRAGSEFHLSSSPGSSKPVTLSVDLTDRTDADRAPVGGIKSRQIDHNNGLVFASDPLPAATEISGVFSGDLDVSINKKDADIEVDLYERTSAGDYYALAPWWTRVSLLRDRTHRSLLRPGARVHLPFQAMRVMSRKLAAGSRIVAVVSAIKEPGRQINYGSGKDVNEETVADAAGEPLTINWFADSFVELPLHLSSRAESRDRPNRALRP